MFPIVEHEVLAPKVHRLSIEAPAVAAKARPGMFVIVIIDAVGERVPFTISGWDKDRGTVEFVFLEVGKTTRQLATLKAGEHVLHFVGPLGRPAEVDRFGHVVAVVSGYGISGMVPILGALKEQENRITTIMQVPDRDSMFGEAALQAVSDDLRVVLGPDGGQDMGAATRLVRGMLDDHPREPIDRIICMGSFCLMRLISEMTRPYEIKTMVHLAPLMVDGTGMCGACRLSVQGRNRFACVHGPEFDGHLVDGWDVLMARRCTYADENLLQQGFQCRSCSQW